MIKILIRMLSNKVYQVKVKVRYIILSNVPQKSYKYLLAKMYKKRSGHKLDWNNLQKYTEKMQWSKINDLNVLKIKLSDKYLVREWVKDKIGEHYLIPLIGVWDFAEQIDFEKLPQKFVLKTNNASGTNILVDNKYNINKEKIMKTLDEWLKIKYGFYKSFEIHYNLIEPKIIAEEYIGESNQELLDYKFLCFDGKVKYCWIDSDRYGDHRRNVYDVNWNLQEWNQNNYKNTEKEIDRPDKFELMLELVEKLAEGFPQVRIDLYNISGRIYFGEATFTNGGGFEMITPEKYDFELGELWDLDAELK